jgi:hypothetical protein
LLVVGTAQNIPNGPVNELGPRFAPGLDKGHAEMQEPPAEVFHPKIKKSFHQGLVLHFPQAGPTASSSPQPICALLKIIAGGALRHTGPPPALGRARALPEVLANFPQGFNETRHL